jgi:hypothetical protein
VARQSTSLNTLSLSNGMPYVGGQSHPIFYLAAQPPGVVYAGKIADEALRRVVHLSLFPDNTLSVARTYLPHDEFAVIWHFNQQGRIKDIDVEVRAVPAKSTRVLTVDQPDEVWMKSNALYAAIPPEANAINQYFANLDARSKYFRLISFGHKLSYRILKHLENESMLDAFFYIEGQQALRYLPKHSPVHEKLASISGLHVSYIGFPLDAQREASSLTINYVPFQRQD